MNNCHYVELIYRKLDSFGLNASGIDFRTQVSRQYSRMDNSVAENHRDVFSFTPRKTKPVSAGFVYFVNINVRIPWGHTTLFHLYRLPTA